MNISNLRTYSSILFFMVVICPEGLCDLSILANDTIPPLFALEPQDRTVSCEEDIITQLSDWYNNGAGAVGADQESSTEIVVNVEISEALDILAANQSINCNQTGSVTLGFNVIDTCGNLSEDMLFATFSVVDTTPPEFDVAPSNLVVQCTANNLSTLSDWINSGGGGSSVQDTCDPAASIISYTWIDIDNNSGAGIINSPTTIVIPDEICDWSVSVTFLAEDECGNRSEANAIFFILDTLGPVFDFVPSDTLFNCDDVPSPFNLIATDACEGFIAAISSDSSTQSLESSSCEFFNYTIHRTYSVSDQCGNNTSFVQVIQVTDTLEPRFIAPADTVLIGENANADPEFTGVPLNIVDNCDSPVEITFTDITQRVNCEVTIMRSWEIQDLCGLSLILPQRITVLDQAPPVVLTEARDVLLSCDSAVLAESLFADWVLSSGGSVVVEGLGFISTSFAATPGSYELDDPGTYPGQAPGSLDPTTCFASLGALRSETVDFVFVDDCDNAVVTTATFSLVDNAPPQISEQLSDLILINDQGPSCEVSLDIEPIQAIDNCAGNDQPTTSSFLVQLSAPNTDVPVDPFTARLGPFNQFFLPTEQVINVLIEQTNIDANNATEYFIVRGEDGSQVGITNLTVSQCEDNETTLSLTRSQFSEWISDDGFLDLSFSPNVVPGVPGLSINDVCGNSFVRVSIALAPTETFDLTSYIEINGGDRLIISQTTEIALGPGMNEIKYIISDCGGQEDSYTRIIEVRDEVGPAFNCPIDTEVNLTAGACIFDYPLPYDLSIFEACPEGIPSEFNLLSGTAGLLQFGFNGSEFEALPLDLNLDIKENGALLEDPILKFFVFADVDEPGETFTIIGENGLDIGETSPVSGGACRTQRFDFNINRDVYLDWIQDGTLSLKIQPNSEGSAINPCQAGVVNQDGESDGISSIGLRLALSQANWDIEVSGATTISKEEFNSEIFPLSAELNSGLNTITYGIFDGAGNGSTCSFQVNVVDATPPTISCIDTIYGTVDPSGVQALSFDMDALNISVQDECGVASTDVTTIELFCSDIGQPKTIQVSSTDIFGNTSICEVVAVAEPFILNPDAEQALCFGDSIRLLANVPATDNPNAYQFNWTGPNGFSSSDENPIIPSASGAESGTYTLEVIGLSGCMSSGSIEIFVQDFTSPPIRIESVAICAGDSLELTTFSFQSEASYNWFSGRPDSGLLLGTTTAPSLKVLPSVGSNSYYLEVESDFCNIDFAPSEVIQVTVFETPVVSSDISEVQLCLGENLRLTAIVDDTTDVNYFWSGPNNYFSTELNPPLLENISIEQAGVYTFEASRAGCLSNSTTLSVEVLDDLPRPEILPVSTICEGEILTLRLSNYSSTSVTYDWFKDSVLISTTNAQFLLVSDVDAETSGSWTVQVRDSLCTSLESASVEVMVQSSLGLNISNDGPVCETDSVQLNSEFIPNATYLWSGPDDFTSSLPNPLVPAIGGVYNLVVSTMEGCITQGSTEVSIVSKPEILGLEANLDVCATGNSSAQFNAEVSDTNVIYNWIGPNNFSSSLPTPIIPEYTSEINGSYVLTIGNGACISEPDTIIVEVRDAPVQPVLPSIISVCSGESLTIRPLSHNASSDNFIWRTPSGQISQPGVSFNIDETSITDGGSYTLITEIGGCQSIESQPVQVTVFRLPNPPSILESPQVCFGDNLTLAVNSEPDTEYEWEGPNGFTSNQPQITIENVEVANQGIYRVRKTQNGCTSQFAESSDIQFFEIPDAPVIVTGAVEICDVQTESIELCIDPGSFSSGSDYIWTNSTNNSILSRSNNLCLDLRTFIGLEEGTNTVVVQRERNGCLSAFSLPVIVDFFIPPNISPQVQEDFSVCEGDNVPISAENPIIGFGEWSSPDPEITFADPFNNETLVFGLKEGNNFLFWSLSNGACLEYASEQLVIGLEESFDASDDQYEIAYNTEGVFSVTNNDNLPEEFEVFISREPNTGLVGVDTELRIVYQSDPRFLGSTDFEYEVCSVSCPGKCSRATVTVTIGDINDCFAPTIITPNNDGVNDQMHIPCLSTGRYRSSELIVYNQWGDEVYYAQPYQNDWAGTYNGRDLPTGTYYYIFKPSPSADIVKGFLILER